jgi:hypothetical protein
LAFVVISFAKGKSVFEVALVPFSIFYGILVLMFIRDNRCHHLPHIHMRWQREEAAVSIEDSSVPDGTLPTKPPKVAQARIEIHKEESGEGDRTIF